MKILQERSKKRLIVRGLFFFLTTTLQVGAQPCPNSTPVDQQFVDDLVAKQSTIGDVHGIATIQSASPDNIQVEVFGRTNGALMKVITKSNGMAVFSQYYDGQFFWYEQGDLIIKVPTEENPNQIIGHAGAPQAEYGLCGYASIAGHSCAMIRIKLTSVNENNVQTIIPGFSGASALGSDTVMWLSTQNGFPYKTAMYDSAMQLVSSATFGNLDFEDLPDSTFTPVVGTKTVTQMSLSEFYSEKGKKAIAGEILRQMQSR